MYSGAGPANQESRNYASAIPTPITNGRIGIPQMLDEQQGSLHHLHEAIAELEKRLGLVLAAVPATDASKAMPPASSQIVDRLQEHDGSLREARARVVSMLDRLQL